MAKDDDDPHPVKLLPWTTPKLIRHGTVEEITQTHRDKVPGTQDEFGYHGVSNP